MSRFLTVRVNKSLLHLHNLTVYNYSIFPELPLNLFQILERNRKIEKLVSVAFPGSDKMNISFLHLHNLKVITLHPSKITIRLNSNSKKK